MYGKSVIIVCGGTYMYMYTWKEMVLVGLYSFILQEKTVLNTDHVVTIHEAFSAYMFSERLLFS